nr:integrase, catalytic region, zinc finger, CCHC-type, peptidase aspartic, catalytic [Tanacetum cinerariifolium]
MVIDQGYQVHMKLNGIGNDIYSTVDACPNAQEMWIAVERLQQGESINIQDVKTKLFCEFEWSRFVTNVKQANNLDNVSYHTLFDILKQHQNKVNEIHAERISRNVNPLALVAATQSYLDDYYQAPPAPKPYKTHTPSSRQTKSTRTHVATRNKGEYDVMHTKPKGIPLSADQSEWLYDIDEEPDEQELKAQYMYVENIQEVLTAYSRPTYDAKPLEKIVQIILFIIDSGCTKHMTENLKLLYNFVEKYLGTVRFGNDQFAPILGYGDLVQGNITIKRVYYVEGLNQNLFSIGQFCYADLEVAFRKSTCFVRDLQGNDLLTGTVDLIST